MLRRIIKPIIPNNYVKALKSKYFQQPSLWFLKLRRSCKILVTLGFSSIFLCDVTAKSLVSRLYRVEK